MKHRRRKTALLTAAVAAVLALQGPFAALAASPQFAYDADTWAKLQDNVMEYGELPYLVQEYNPTYLNNQTTYQAGRDTKNAKEVQDKQYNQANDLYDSADNLRDQADQIEDFLGLPGSYLGLPKSQTTAGMYASLMSASILLEQNALKTQQTADASYRDSEMDRLDYINNQDAVVVQVQSAFAAYNQVKKTIPLMEKSLELQELSLEMTQKRQQLGQATQIDVLNAQKSLQSLQSTLTQTKAGLQAQHQQLCVQTGWSYDAEPDIQDLPQADFTRIAAMNLAADTQTALEQNLSLQSNKRGYANMAEGSADKKNMDRTIKNQEQTIRSGMQTLYNDIMQKQTALQLADASLAAETQTMNAMQKKLELGMATQLEYKSEEVSFLEKQIDKETANMNLQQAIETYEWALKGYMK